MKVYVLMEEVDVLGVLTSYQAALDLARELRLENFDIQEFTLRGKP